MLSRVQVWDLEKDKKLYELDHPCHVERASLGSLGHLLVTSGSDKLLTLYDLRRVGNKDLIKNYDIGYFVSPSPFLEKPNKRYTVMRSLTDHITVWDNDTGTKVEC